MKKIKSETFVTIKASLKEWHDLLDLAVPMQSSYDNEKDYEEAKNTFNKLYDIIMEAE